MIKNNLLTIIFCIFTIFLFVFTSSNLLAAKEGFGLWINSIIPSLFPFLVAVELLKATNLSNKLGNYLSPIMKPLFNVSGAGAYVLIMGIISGYPIGAKIVTDFRKNNICSKEECERLLAFTNNSGPLFIIGSVGISMFLSKEIGILLFITHILSCITVGFIFRFWKKPNNNSNINNNNNNNKSIDTNNHINNYEKNSYDYDKENKLSISNLGSILANSILSSVKTLILIGGFVILFCIIISIFKRIYIIDLISKIINPILNVFGIKKIQFATGLSSGLFEITHGIKYISSIPYKYISANVILSSFLLGFGGLSVLLQVWSIISETDLSLKPYIIGKILQGILSAFYTYLFINQFQMFNLNL